MAPLFRYHKEVWAAGDPQYATKDTLTVPELRQAYELAKNEPSGSNEQAGPIGMAAAAANRVGWTFITRLHYRTVATKS